MLVAIACCRRLAASSASASAVVVMASIPWLMRSSSPGSLHDQLGVQRAGGLDGAQDRDHVARVGLQAVERLHQVRDRGAGAAQEAGPVLFLDLDAAVADDLGTRATDGADQVGRL